MNMTRRLVECEPAYRFKDVLRFMYYKLALAFKKIMAHTRFYDKLALPRATPQTVLCFIDSVSAMVNN